MKGNKFGKASYELDILDTKKLQTKFNALKKKYQHITERPRYRFCIHRKIMQIAKTKTNKKLTTLYNQKLEAIKAKD